MTEHPGARQSRLGEALRKAAKISGIGLQGIDSRALAAELDAAGLLVTSEREAELRREGAFRVGVQLECAYDRHIHSQPVGTWREADEAKAEGLREAIDIARRTSARPTSEENHG